ncbi:hypothetical protein HYQ44_018938 [Verticillium longisporum]|nr:hypothetical protein HYQ44_018938 [Verticillium longisporum]
MGNGIGGTRVSEDDLVSVGKHDILSFKIHFAKSGAPDEDPKLVTKALNLMHRFDPADVEAKMDEIEQTKA